MAALVTGIAANTCWRPPHRRPNRLPAAEACVATVHDNPDGNHPTTMATKLIDAGARQS